MSSYITRHQDTINTKTGEIENSWRELVQFRGWNIPQEVYYIRAGAGIPVHPSIKTTIVLPDCSHLESSMNVSYKYTVDTSLNFDTEVLNPSEGNLVSKLNNGELQLKFSFKNQDLAQGERILDRLYIDIKDQDGNIYEYRKILFYIENTPSTSPTIYPTQSELRLTYYNDLGKVYPTSILELATQNIPDEEISNEHVSLGKFALGTSQPYDSPKPFRLSFPDKDKTGKIASVEVEPDAGLTGEYDESNCEIIYIFPPNDVLEYKPLGTRIYINFVEEKRYIALEQQEFRLQTYEGSITPVGDTLVIDNPHNGTLEVIASTLLSVDIKYSEGKCYVDFFVDPKNLLVGEYDASISVGNDYVELVASVKIYVDYTISYESGKFYFCKENTPLKTYRSHPNSDLVVMTLSMDFSSSGGIKEEIVQSYENVFLKDKVVFFPGEEIEDFFPRIIFPSELPADDSKIVPSYLFSAASVNIKIEEFAENEVVKTTDFYNLRFLPGYKPKAYPYLTNATLRSTYSKSLIALCSINSELKSKFLTKIASLDSGLTSLKDDADVSLMLFSRKVVDETYGDLNIATHEGLSLEPKPNVDAPIHVLFQNQNNCIDWFSFSGEYTQYAELNHVLATKFNRGKIRKHNTDRKPKLKLNTGWIFREEADLLDEMMSSPVCLVYIKEAWKQVVCVGTKTLEQNEEDGIYSFVVEFQMEDNER